MPAVRISRRSSAINASAPSAPTVTKRVKKDATSDKASQKPVKPVAVDEDISTTHPYPKTCEERENVINPQTKRKVTPFQFQVYDLCAQIPKGQVSTYKYISDALQSSSRAVGQALRVNPYAPLPVPCHRVLNSKLFIGGFKGQWGEGERVDSKKAKLFNEGVVFDEKDHVAVEIRDKVIFNDFKPAKGIN
ncbi:methylated-DNA--protein-cysteine methyltransferase [Dissophora globulifera]|uniref:Methylated-DNA--protein-cysteine methyltransferase n=1 Tax=Dissophora globulifera TaxID=979702 RepID=A0A9P6R806_9FUNG|nr:methylated-DNA--protein-cysteine methyltransferase [Dissophora globulifera]